MAFMQKMQQQLSDARAEKDALEKQLRACQRQHGEAVANNGDLRQRVAVLEEGNGEKERALEEAQSARRSEREALTAEFDTQLDELRLQLSQEQEVLRREHAKVKQLEAQISERDAVERDAQEDHRRLVRQLRAVEDELGTAKQAADEREEALAQQWKSQLRNSQSECQALATKAAEFQGRLTERERDCDAAKLELQSLRARCESAQRDLNETRATMNERAAKAAEGEREMRRALEASRVDAARGEERLSGNAAIVKALHAQVRGLQEAVRMRKRQVEASRDQNEALKGEIDGLITAHEDALARVRATCDERVNSEVALREQLVAELQQTREEMADMFSQLAERNNLLAMLDNRLDGIRPFGRDAMQSQRRAASATVKPCKQQRKQVPVAWEDDGEEDNASLCIVRAVEPPGGGNS